MYYLMNKAKNRVILETEFDFMVLSGDMNYLDKTRLDDLPTECKPYKSFLKAKFIAWLSDLEVVKRSELVEIILNFKKKCLQESLCKN